MQFATRSSLFASVATSLVLCGLVQGGPASRVSSAALARYEAAQAVWDLASNKLKMGREDFGGETATADEARFLWSDRLAAASVTAGVLSAVDAYAQHVARMEEHAELTEVLQRGGRRSERDVAAMKYFVADARVQLERVSK